jgi:hypothetical protein
MNNYIRLMWCALNEQKCQQKPNCLFPSVPYSIGTKNIRLLGCTLFEQKSSQNAKPGFAQFNISYLDQKYLAYGVHT